MTNGYKSMGDGMYNNIRTRIYYSVRLYGAIIRVIILSNGERTGTGARFAMRKSTKIDFRNSGLICFARLY